MLSSILIGRAQLAFGTFRHNNHLLLYTWVLGIVELLQPHVFVHDHFAVLVETYFTAIKV